MPRGPHPAGADGVGADDAALEQVATLHRRAVEAIEQHRVDDAGRLVDEGLERLARLVSADSARARELEARLTLSRSWVVAERSGPTAGFAELDRALALAEAAGLPGLAALCHNQAAIALGRIGDLGGALTRMRLAEPGLPLLPDADQVRILVNRGTLALHLMQLDDARADLDRAVELAHAHGHTANEFMARHNAGYVEFLRGDLPAALRLMAEADAMPVDVARGVSRLDRARVLLEAGLLTDAAAGLREAAELLADSPQDLAETELDLARVTLLLGDPAAAQRLAATARRRFRDREAGSWRRQAQLVELEAVALDHGDGSRSRRTARLAEALGTAAAAHDEEHLARRAALVSADALLDLGDREGALAAYRTAAGLHRSGSLATRLHVRLVGARLADTNRRAGAILAAAADDLARAQHRSASLDLRTAMAVHGSRLAATDLALGFESRSVASLFTRSERWRAVSDRVPVVHPPPDPRLADLLSRLRRVREDLRSAPPEAHPGLRASAAALESEARALTWTTAASASGDGSPTRTVRYAAALAAVRERECELVSYVPHGSELHAVHLSARGGRAVRIGPVADIAALVQRVRADVEAAALPVPTAMRAAIEASLQHGLAQLDAAVLGPLRGSDSAGGPGGRGGSRGAQRGAGLLDGRLVVVPNRTLAAVPWGMLPSRRGRPTTVARTVTAWSAAPARPVLPRPAGPRVVAVAGPDLDDADLEVAEVAQAWGGVAMPAAQATRAAVMAALPGADLVHLAAHGTHQHQSPLFSTVRLADGATFAHELPMAGLAASHVVLAACEVGRATIRPGDESLGLTAVLLSLGVRCVVAPVSRIPDGVAREAMAAYHRLLADGHDASSALAEATADLPTVARAFTCLGTDWRANPD